MDKTKHNTRHSHCQACGQGHQEFAHAERRKIGLIAPASGSQLLRLAGERVTGKQFSIDNDQSGIPASV
ncbi:MULTISPECIES: hypothetical protein [Rhizobium]|uniref:hypothetical protein n=1 Tax=Rhizobium TaxID=379 RepID=UPI00124D59D0|nr:MULTISPECIES: hypothetical protein [Rhizobium]KAF5887156.1 hypothetical protein FY112_04245 [Rhizobium sp. PEPV16]MBY3095634.1 hypothetical protein [Rhizobium laguerreae]MBY3102845.1 hypothetical protein [Rhizobium laguerreae]MBY3109207.1 hypothetical protein [Rhizobium laguerreae]MBY3129992.1 hypothetical protein [Rhizobium laguerreae]